MIHADSIILDPGTYSSYEVTFAPMLEATPDVVAVHLENLSATHAQIPVPSI